MGVSLFFTRCKFTSSATVKHVYVNFNTRVTMSKKKEKVYFFKVGTKH